MKKLFAVVTGASQGLGKSIAIELAKRRQNLLLVSLPNQNLSGLCTYIKQQYGIEASYWETDLSVKENVILLSDWINNNYHVNYLVNNAGLGGTKKFEEATLPYIESIIQLNVVATSLLTHQLLPNLKQQTNSYILNISSLAAFSPIGYKTVYPASKAFIHSFSIGLNQELKDTNIFVSVVNPGAMATNAEVTNRIKKLGIWGKLTLLDPDKVAHKCIEQLVKRNKVIVVNPISRLLLRLIPIWVRVPLMTQAIKKEIL